ncbi:MAG: hypothetical protein GKR91_12700 [Pseudomonadales bacterium]|nr:hypothetical protein [Pseudomonadales bacterium]
MSQREDDSDSMFLKILKRAYQQLVMLVLVSVILLAAYVSAGRQFMPVVSRYASTFEERIVEFTGVPVSVDSLTGTFEGFNPQIRVNGLRLLVGATAEDENASALVFNSATVIVDIPRSIWERRWILEDFVVETLEINFQQDAEGSWQLAGLESSGEAAEVNLDDLFQSLRSVAFLNLNNADINFRNNTGRSFSLNNGSAAIQNLGDAHFLHVNGDFGENGDQIAFSFEVTGNELAEVNGVVHIDLPSTDYSEIFVGQSLSAFSVEELVGGGNLWLSINEGQLTGGTTELALERVTLIGQEMAPVTLENISGGALLSRDLENNSLEIILADMAVNWEDHYWRPFNIYTAYTPEQSISIRADSIDLALVSQLAIASGLLDDSARSQLEQYSPAGKLENLSFIAPLGDSSELELSLRSNIASVEIGTVNGSPNMWGLNGYLDLSYDSSANLISGFGEMESDEFSINLPNVFTSVWDYTYVNGRLNFRVDLNNGQEVKLVSSMVVAESEVVDGHAKFSSRVHQYPDGEREACLDLFVGAERVNAEYKSVYLPDGPNIDDNLRQNMEWLDTAVLSGEVRDSGVIFRGSTRQGSDAMTKTFQSYYLMSDGEINFADDWPNISSMSGYVYTDDNNIDIEVLSGESLNLDLGAVIGEVRRNAADENWLTVNGQSAGLTASGLNYLQQAPLGERLKNSFANWRAEGDLAADIEVRVPLNLPGREPEVRLNVAVADNNLEIPDYALSVRQLTGPVIFDSITGLEPSYLTAQLFGRPVAMELSSQVNEGEIETIFVNAEGSGTREELIAWPQQSRFVQDVLTEMDGDLVYSANLSLEQREDSAQGNTLIIDSELAGAALNLPQPFGKSADETTDLHIELQFGDAESIVGNFGENVQFELGMEEGAVNGGVVTVGSYDAPLSSLSESDSEGIMIIGEMDRLVLEEWTRFLGELNSTSNPSADLNNAIGFVDVQLDILELYEQELPGVAMRIEGDAASNSWAINLDSDSIQGLVNFPFDQEDYLRLDLAYLRLPGDEEDVLTEGLAEEEVVEAAVEEEPIDVLVDIDPRELPPMYFSTEEFAIGSRPFGAFDFTFVPNAEGAEVRDIVFDFRGLRLNMEGPYIDGTEVDEYSARFAPSFDWYFDGSEHRSELTGILYADNMADVLTANGYAAMFESENAIFFADISWPGTPAFFGGSNLSGEIDMDIENGRFLQGSGGQGALRLISILNFNAIMTRARISNDLVRTGLAYDEITAELSLDDGHVNIEDRLVISGPSSLYQITGELDLDDETILGEMFVTLPVSDNIPWLGLLTANIPLAVGAYLFDQIFGDQVDSLTSAVYTLDGPWEGLEPEFKQAFGSPEESQEASID